MSSGAGNREKQRENEWCQVKVRVVSPWRPPWQLGISLVFFSHDRSESLRPLGPLWIRLARSSHRRPQIEAYATLDGSVDAFQFRVAQGWRKGSARVAQGCARACPARCVLGRAQRAAKSQLFLRANLFPSGRASGGPSMLRSISYGFPVGSGLGASGTLVPSAPSDRGVRRFRWVG